MYHMPTLIMSSPFRNCGGSRDGAGGGSRAGPGWVQGWGRDETYSGSRGESGGTRMNPKVGPKASLTVGPV